MCSSSSYSLISSFELQPLKSTEVVRMRGTTSPTTIPEDTMTFLLTSPLCHSLVRCNVTVLHLQSYWRRPTVVIWMDWRCSCLQCCTRPLDGSVFWFLIKQEEMVPLAGTNVSWWWTNMSPAVTLVYWHLFTIPVEAVQTHQHWCFCWNTPSVSWLSPFYFTPSSASFIWIELETVALCRCLKSELKCSTSCCSRFNYNWFGSLDDPVFSPSVWLVCLNPVFCWVVLR